jgi:nucleoside-diphosphate-sugar epimerase
MRVLVSGAGGFLGRHVVDRLCERGHSVRAIIRPTSSAPKWARGVEIFRADLEVSNDLETAFAEIDAVIHLAGASRECAQIVSTVASTERFLNAMVLSRVKRLIHVSSLVVYDWAQVRGILDENSRLLDDTYDMGVYTIAKVQQERIVTTFSKDHAWHLTITRPGFVWGPQRALIAGMGRHRGPFFVMFGPCNRLPLCHVVNCADCLVTILETPAAIGETFNVIDGDHIRVWRYVREYARRTGQRGFMLPVPYSAGHGVARVASLTSQLLFRGKGRLPSLLTPRQFESQFKPLRFSNRKLRDVLAWVPPLSFEDGLKVTYGSGGR